MAEEKKEDKSAKKNQLPLAIVVVFLIAIGLFLGWRSLSMQKGPETGPDKMAQKDASSLVELFKSGDSFRCTYTSQSGEVTVLAKGGKIKVDGFSYATPEGQETRGFMINDGETIYFWSEGEGKGTKYSLSAMADQAQDQTADQTAEKYQDPQEWAAETEEKYQVDCQKTSVSNSEFIPPQNIEFQDISQMFEKTKELQQLQPSPGEGMSEEQREKVKEVMDEFGQ